MLRDQPFQATVLLIGATHYRKSATNRTRSNLQLADAGIPGSVGSLSLQQHPGSRRHQCGCPRQDDFIEVEMRVVMRRIQSLCWIA